MTRTIHDLSVRLALKRIVRLPGSVNARRRVGTSSPARIERAFPLLDRERARSLRGILVSVRVIRRPHNETITLPSRRLFMLSRISFFRALAVVIVGLAVTSGSVMAGNVVLNFSDVPPGTLVVNSPYQSQGFTLTSTSGGFVFNSPDTGNGTPQPVGNNPFYAGANALAAFAPATITLTPTTGDPFSLLSIDLARNFEFDPAPTVTFTGTLAGGGTVSETFMVTTPPPPSPPSFQTFDFTGFTDVTSVSWDQSSAALHQFTNITISTGAVPEPAALTLLALGIPLALAYTHHFRRRRGPCRSSHAA
jgi:hypothetical protein